MADNVAITAGTGTLCATDDIGTVQFQRVKLIHGIDGVNDGDVARTNGLPVAQVAAVVPAATVMQNAVVATGNGTSLTVTGYGTAVLQIAGTFVATVNFEASVDAGATWTAIQATQVGSGDIAGSTTGTGTFRITCTGIDLIRARVTWTSGTSVTVNGRVSNAPNASKIVRLATGTNAIGSVTPYKDLLRIADSSASAELTIATTAYTAGDQVGVMFQFAAAARASGGTGMLVGMQLTSAADIIGAYDVVLCRSNITLAADNAAFAISDADALNVIGLVQLAGAFDIGNNRIVQAFNLAVPYDCLAGTILYGALITRAGHTFFGAHTDLQLTAWVERN